ncbi:MAG: DUF5615 family PIN-like protein [Segetibacter sp.]
MKILLDENIPIQLKRDLPENYKWFTVRELGWQGTKNGQLLERMIENNFEGLVTMDKNLYKQQNISGLSLFIIIIKAKDNKTETLKEAIPEIMQLLTSKMKGIFEVIV